MTKLWNCYFVKSSPNFTAACFRIWINDVLLLAVQYHPQVTQQIFLSTAAHCLHALGFHPSQSHKGIYINGHEWADIVEYRKLYIHKLEILEATHAPLPPCSNDPIRVRQEEDESKKLVSPDISR